MIYTRIRYRPNDHPLHDRDWRPIVWNLHYFIDNSSNVFGILRSTPLNVQTKAKDSTKTVNPLFAATPKNFRIGGDIMVGQCLSVHYFIA